MSLFDFVCKLKIYLVETVKSDKKLKMSIWYSNSSKWCS